MPISLFRPLWIPVLLAACSAPASSGPDPAGETDAADTETDEPSRTPDEWYDHFWAHSFHCWEGGTTVWVHPDDKGRIVYNYYDYRREEDEPEFAWCRKLGKISKTAAYGERNFDFVFDHTAPADELDYVMYVRPIPPEEALSERPNFWLIWDWTELETYQEDWREEITIPCEMCTTEERGFGDCEAPRPPWPIGYRYPLDDVYVCPPSDGNPDLDIP